MTGIKIVLLGMLVTAYSLAYSQSDEEPKDTVVAKVWKITGSSELGDTAWWALQQKTNTEFLNLVPSLAVIRETFDSLEIKNNPQIIRIKYNYISYKVTKQLKTLQLKARKNKLKFKTCELDKIQTKEGKDAKGNEFAYVVLFAHKGKREFTIKFVALKLTGNWYIADELAIEFPEDDPFYKPPIKVLRH